MLEGVSTRLRWFPPIDDKRIIIGVSASRRASLSWRSNRLDTEGAPMKTGLFELLDFLRDNRVPCAAATSSARPVADAMLSHAGG